MNTYDPRIVVQSLEDLQDEITRWSSAASDTLASATTSQMHAQESVDRILHKAAIVKDRAENDKLLVESSISRVEETIERGSTAVVTAKETLQDAQNRLNIASSTLDKWQAELYEALAWLERAEARLAKAVDDLERARNALRQAEWELRTAEARLRNCQNDPNRHNCSGEAAAVNRARLAVIQAKNWVVVAEQEVIAAKEEVERAKKRVACCRKAVALSTEAVKIAQESIASANQALNFAERSLELAHTAERFVLSAQKNMLLETEQANNMLSEAQAAQSLSDNAANYLSQADRAEEAAQRYASSVKTELDYRIQQLRNFNSPSILTPGDWSLPRNVYPSEIKVYTRSDGKTQIIYGHQRDRSGRIIGSHGHTVLKRNGKIDYARTQKGSVKKDTGD